MRIAIAACLLATTALSAAADEKHRDLDAHEHGVGQLNIAIEANQIAIELEAPGADIVGFEHAAESDGDKARIKEALATLGAPMKLFTLPEKAGCKLAKAEVELHSEGEEEHDKHDDDDHAEKMNDDHDHDGHAEKKDDDHDHDEHEHDEGGTHSEFQATYTLACADTSAIAAIDLPYFSKFPNAKELEVQLVSEKGANKFEVERDAPRLDLSGMI